MGLDRDIAGLGMGWQGDGDGRRLVAPLAPALEGQVHGVGVRDTLGQRFGDGGLQLGGAVTLEQTTQRGGDGAEIAAALGGPLIADELGLRLSAERRANRGVIRNVTRGGYDDAMESLLVWTRAWRCAGSSICWPLS